MSKTINNTIDFVWETIQKMNLGEKYAFRRNQSNNKTPLYFILYDAILDQKEYNEKELKLKLKNTIPENKFNYIKHILLQKLCTSNAQTYLQHDTEMQALQLLQIVRMLRIKGQITLATKYLKKLISIANTHEYVSLLRMSFDEMIRIELFNKNDDTMKGVSKSIAKTNLVFANYNETIKIQNLYLKLIPIRRKSNLLINDDDKKELTQIKNELKLIKISTKNSSFFTSYYNMSDATIHYLEGNTKQAYTILQKNIHLWQTNKITVSTDPEYYFDCLSLYTDIGIFLNKFTDVLNACYHICNNQLSGAYAKATIEMIQFRCKNRIYNKQGNFENVQQLIKSEKPNFEIWNKYANNEYRTLLYAGIGLSLYNLKNYNDGIYYVKQVIQSFNTATRKEIQSVMYLLLVIFSYDLKQNIIFESNYNNAYSHFYRHNNPLLFEKLILQLLKNTYNHQKSKSSKQKMEKVLEQLENNKNDFSQKVIFNYFNFPRWIKSKIKGVDYADLIKEELKNN